MGSEMDPAHVYLGLVHYPVYDKRKEIVATAVTNFDVHDLARCARTYGLGGLFIITPLESQLQLVDRIVRHWVAGAGAAYNPTRGESLSLLRTSRSIEEVEETLSSLWKGDVQSIATGASPHAKSIGFSGMRKEIEERGTTPFLLLFGTGWGLTEDVKERAGYVLAPIEGKGYNHLPVRSAVSIILDRLFGDR
jgi:hypothetical protein